MASFLLPGLLSLARGKIGQSIGSFVRQAVSDILEGKNVAKSISRAGKKAIGGLFGVGPKDLKQAANSLPIIMAPDRIKKLTGMDKVRPELIDKNEFPTSKISERAKVVSAPGQRPQKFIPPREKASKSKPKKKTSKSKQKRGRKRGRKKKGKRRFGLSV